MLLFHHVAYFHSFSVSENEKGVAKTFQKVIKLVSMYKTATALISYYSGAFQR